MKKESLEALLDKMTLKEKVGQLVQLSPNFFEESLDSYLTGPMQDIDMTDEDLYTIGSTLNIQNKEQAYNIQKTYLENNRLKIPLLIMADVIHGYKTIFPIPLAIGSSWNPSLVHDIADLSALEASSEGVHITFSPMVDLVRDPRWGRVLESTGEDTYLNSVYAKEFVSGYQGSSDLSDDPTKIASCVKHFIGYGLSEAGRDYNRVDMSDLEMYENHLPAFRSALEAGAKLVMTSFNVIHGIPVTGNKNLLENILRKELDFDGVLISDWNAVGELIPNGVAENHKEAALKSIEAGVDIDMMALSYYRYLEELAKESSEILALINTAVWRVLTLKNELGLFENPFRGFNNQVKMDNHRDKAREIASKTMVLLENDNLLPLKREANIGLIGPFADNHDLLGA
ncbi:MAG: beta-glucosidase, partial [Atopostipes sp.]|nr:beta-glucosidase [Atopostipes sp.]